MGADSPESRPVPDIDLTTLPRYPDLDGQVAIVTGGSAGIGAATCRVLAANGVHVAVVDRDAAGAARVVAQVERDGGRALGIVADATRADDIAAVRRQVETAYGPVGLALPFVGGFEAYTPVHELTEETFDQIVRLNLTSTFLLIREVLPGMIDRGSGAIVTMGSMSGRYLDALVTAPYAAAKAGIVMLTRHVAQEAGPHGIRVNCVCPSTTRSERADRLIDVDTRDALARRSPLGRMGLPVDTANAAAYLASGVASGWVTGVALDVAGGRVML
jgi:3-oxoacyl-[acyl-carrier protein] reductase